MYVIYKFVQLFSLFVLIWVSLCDKSSYKLGTVGIVKEVAPIEYTQWIEKATSEGVDLLLMPELMLLSLPEEVTVGSNPCLEGEEDAPTQHMLSCSVRENNIYFSYDMMELGDKCVRDVDPRCLFGYYIYNTEVVFDRYGTILTKYRKRHIPLNMEWIFTNGDGKPVSFETDFNVSFGIFICYDLFFSNPAETLVKDGIDHFLFSHHFPVLNPLPPLQFEQGWSEFFSVELTASNDGPCGIYSSGIPLAYNNSRTESFLVTAEYDKKDRLRKTRLPNQNKPFAQDRVGINRIVTEPVKGENITHEFLYSPGISDQIVFNLTDFDCVLSYKTSDKSSKKKEFFRFSATTLDMDAVFQPFNSTMYFCGLMNCGDSTFDCNVFEIYKNLETSSYFDEIRLEMIFKPETPVRMVLPFLSTENADLFRDFDNFEISHGAMEHSIVTKKHIEQPVLGVALLGEYDVD